VFVIWEGSSKSQRYVVPRGSAASSTLQFALPGHPDVLTPLAVVRLFFDNFRSFLKQSTAALDDIVIEIIGNLIKDVLPKAYVA
jgi:hypothetical protein